ncbi:MAG: antitoxin VapB family protein [Verrucomicrobiota bacterium]
MKTISLTEEAYARLKAWKLSPKESFSQVVLKAVPKRGTAADLDRAFDALGTPSAEQWERMEAALAEGNDWRSHGDAWAQEPGRARSQASRPS